MVTVRPIPILASPKALLLGSLLPQGGRNYSSSNQRGSLSPLLFRGGVGGGARLKVASRAMLVHRHHPLIPSSKEEGVLLLLPHPQRGNKRFLRNGHVPIFPHPCGRENSAPRCFLILPNYPHSALMRKATLRPCGVLQ